MLLVWQAFADPPLPGNLSVPGLLNALANPDPAIYQGAMKQLASASPNAGEMATLEKGFVGGRYPLDVAGDAWDIVKQHDDAGLPAFSRDMAEMTIKMESAALTMDQYGWNYRLHQAQIFRIVMLSRLAGSKDERFIPVAKLILDTDPEADTRIDALDYLKGLPPEKSGPLLIAALGSGQHRTQAHAALIIGLQHIGSAEEPLKALLASPSVWVRMAVMKALRDLGAKPPDALPPRTLPAGAVRIAQKLWECGLKESEIIEVCSHPSPKAFAPFETKPNAAMLPEQVVLAADPSGMSGSVDDNALTMPIYQFEVRDPWRMSAMDAASVKKRAMQYAVGVDNEHGADPGPLLLAAAVKLNETAAAQAVYEKLCSNGRYDTDDDILAHGIEGLAWIRYCAGLERYELRNDNGAVESFASAASLEKFRPPPLANSFLDAHIQQSLLLIGGIVTRRAANEKPAPIFPEKQGAIAYWAQQYPNKTERIKALIAHLDDVGAKNATPDHSWMAPPADSLMQALVNEGDDAVGPLIDCMEHDTRLDRLVEPDRGGIVAARVVGRVRRDAYEALADIFNKQFITDNTENDAFDNGDQKTISKLATEMRDYEKTRKSNPAPAP